MKVDLASVRRKFDLTLDFVTRLTHLEERLASSKVDERTVSEISAIYSVR